MVGIVPLDEEFSAGRYMERAHAEVDAALDAGRTPIVVGGTGSTSGLPGRARPARAAAELRGAAGGRRRRRCTPSCGRDPSVPRRSTRATASGWSATLELLDWATTGRAPATTPAVDDHTRHPTLLRA